MLLRPKMLLPKMLRPKIRPHYTAAVPPCKLDVLSGHGEQGISSALYPFGEIQDFQAPLLRAFDRVSRSSFALRQKTHADGTPVRHITVAVLHTAPEATLRKAY